MNSFNCHIFFLILSSIISDILLTAFTERVCPPWSSGRLNERPRCDRMSDTIIGNKKHEQGIEDITHWSKKSSGTRPVKSSASIKCWAAYDSNGESVQIESAVKGRTYFCPDCNEKMHPWRRSTHRRKRLESTASTVGGAP